MCAALYHTHLCAALCKGSEPLQAVETCLVSGSSLFSRVKRLLRACVDTGPTIRQLRCLRRHTYTRSASHLAAASGVAAPMQPSKASAAPPSSHTTTAHTGGTSFGVNKQRNV
eukprot:jgi/Ulvmu1/11941/UM082_0020.1